MSDKDTGDTSRCPECGESFNVRETFAPNEGPNKSENIVECFFHDGQRFCSREAHTETSRSGGGE